jgi:ATP/ADP translocase
MSVPGGQSKLKRHEVNYVVKDGQWFQLAVVTILVIILGTVIFYGESLREHQRKADIQAREIKS